MTGAHQPNRLFRPRRKQNQVISLSAARQQFLFRAIELESLFRAAQAGTPSTSGRQAGFVHLAAPVLTLS